MGSAKDSPPHTHPALPTPPLGTAGKISLVLAFLSFVFTPTLNAEHQRDLKTAKRQESWALFIWLLMIKFTAALKSKDTTPHAFSGGFEGHMLCGSSLMGSRGQDDGKPSGAFLLHPAL